MLVKDCLDLANWGGKSHPKYGWDPRLNEKKRITSTELPLVFCFPTVDAVWPATCSCHHIFPVTVHCSTRNCTSKWSHSSLSCLLQDVCYSNKVNNYKSQDKEPWSTSSIQGREKAMSSGGIRKVFLNLGCGRQETHRTQRHGGKGCGRKVTWVREVELNIEVQNG